VKVLAPPLNRDLVTALGVVFRDGVGGARVIGGLSARAWPEGQEGRSVTATVNAVGVAVFHRLQAAKKTAPPDAPAGYVLEVRDAEGRFQTGRLRVVPPAKGVVLATLWTAPARPAPPGMTAMRAELWDETNNRAAAFARVSVTIKVVNGYGANPPKVVTVAEGLTDATGTLLALGDWPKPKLRGDGADRWDRPMEVELAVGYRPSPAREAPRLDELDGLPAARVLAERGKNDPFVPPKLVPATAFRSDNSLERRQELANAVAVTQVEFRSVDPLGRLLIVPA